MGFVTLGCKTNQFETQAMEALFRERGFVVVGPGEECDVTVVNSCSVTGTAGQKSRQELRKARRNNPRALVAVCGCYAKQEGEALVRSGDADLAGSNRDHAGFVADVAALLDGEKGERREKNDAREFESLSAGGLAGRTRALLKIEDGCKNFCAYCIIPSLRGPVRSIDPERAKEEVVRLAGEGYREVVLTGIEISSYGADLPGKPSLAALAASLCESAPGVRFRLGSLEPRIVDGAFCDLLSSRENLCPHFHLSLQSGSAATLSRMGRKYTPERYLEAASLLRERFPFCSITTDVIVGFPGETEEEFAETLAFCRKVGFERMHVFPFSKREGTRAASMEGQIEKKVKEERAARLRRLAAGLAEEGLARRVGRVEEVLFESGEGESGSTQGYTASYLPVAVPEGAEEGACARVRILSVEKGKLVGKICE